MAVDPEAAPEPDPEPGPSLAPFGPGLGPLSTRWLIEAGVPDLAALRHRDAVTP